LPVRGAACGWSAGGGACAIAAFVKPRSTLVTRPLFEPASIGRRVMREASTRTRIDSPNLLRRFDLDDIARTSLIFPLREASFAREVVCGSAN
jgi:hypothetical protein